MQGCKLENSVADAECAQVAGKKQFCPRRKVVTGRERATGARRVSAAVPGENCGSAGGGSSGGGRGVVRWCGRRLRCRSQRKRELPGLPPAGGGGARRKAGRTPAARRDRTALLE